MHVYMCILYLCMCKGLVCVYSCLMHICVVYAITGDDELQRAQGCRRLYPYPILHERLLPRLRPGVRGPAVGRAWQGGGGGGE